MINILVLGDVCGRPGRRAVRDFLPGLVGRHEVDLVIANGENSAGGLGVTIKAAEELFQSGVNVLTSGNHIFRHKEIEEYLNRNERIIRPANYPLDAPGRGSVVVETAGGFKIGVINIMGRTYMTPIDCPFQTVEREIEKVRKLGARLIIVDFHAEATSEKKAMGWFLDGRVDAVLGTHTHVQTADEAILPGGTAYLTDLGMTGPHHSVIGMKSQAVIQQFLSGRPSRFEVAKRGIRLEGVLLSVKVGEKNTLDIERIRQDIVVDEKK